MQINSENFMTSQRLLREGTLNNPVHWSIKDKLLYLYLKKEKYFYLNQDKSLANQKQKLLLCTAYLVAFTQQVNLIKQIFRSIKLGKNAVHFPRCEICFTRLCSYRIKLWTYVQYSKSRFLFFLILSKTVVFI